MWIGVLQQSPQCGNLRHALTDPYYLGHFLQVKEKKKTKNKKGRKPTRSFSFVGIGVPHLEVYFSLQQNVFSVTNFSEENFFITKRYYIVTKFIFRHYL